MKGRLRVLMNNVQKTISYAVDGEHLYIGIGALTFSATEVTLSSARGGDGSSDGVIKAPMNGRVIDVMVAEGDTVSKGQVVTILEAMKMEHEITAKIDGTVTKISAKSNDQVASKAVLLEIEATGE